MSISVSTKKILCLLFVFTLCCDIGQHVVHAKTLPHADASLSETVYSALVNQQLLEIQNPLAPLGSEGGDRWYRLIAVLLLILYAACTRTLHRYRPQNEFLPKGFDLHGMIPLPLAPPSLRAFS